MERNRKITILIVTILLISLIGLGIAFAAFSTTLTINGSASVEASSWDVVFEGADGSNTIGAPTLVGSAEEVTHPTIKNNSTEISNYEVTLKSPGDSVTYNFKIHNKGDYAADLTSLTVAGVNRPDDYVRGNDLRKKKTYDNYSALLNTHYSFYYTSDNMPVGRYQGRDCLEPGESENVSLRIRFDIGDAYWVLPSEDVVLDNLGISATYTQTNNDSCPPNPGESVSNNSFVNIDYAYYTYEGKSFKGTGVNNIIISENIIGISPYSTIECSDGSAPGGPAYNPRCSNGATVIFTGSPAQDMMDAYCTGCRLITESELSAWGCNSNSNSKCIGYYNGVAEWWYFDKLSGTSISCVTSAGTTGGSSGVTSNTGVRPVVSIPSTATMTGSGTQQDPYVIQ